MSEDLIRAARQGNRGAVAVLLSRYVPTLSDLASMELSGRDVEGVDAVGLVQRTLQMAERDFATFAGSTQTQYLQWLCGLLQRNVKEAILLTEESAPESTDTLRAGDRTPVCCGPDELTVPARSTSATGSESPIVVAIHSLAAVPRDVVRLRLMHGWTIVRIARHLGLDEVMVARLLRLGLRRLSAVIQEEGKSDS
jgi:DNA-directed RNA polymerase specialized sigma24 family protein